MVVAIGALCAIFRMRRFFFHWLRCTFVLPVYTPTPVLSHFPLLPSLDQISWTKAQTLNEIDPWDFMSCSNAFNNYGPGSPTADPDRAFQWLSLCDPRERHRAIGIDRVAGVSDWLFLTSQFTQWNGSYEETTKPLLFCYGGPGVGKTFFRYG